jgi:hypothetical protein
MSGNGVLRFLPEAVRRRSSVSNACCLRPQALRASPRLGFLPLQSIRAATAAPADEPPGTRARSGAVEFRLVRCYATFPV